MKIVIMNQAYEKVMYWVRKADFEVSGYGTAHWDASLNAFVVTDAFLIKQKGGPAHTEIDAVALGKLVHRIEDVEKKGMIKWWWHSHVNMDAFWSGTDTDTIKSLGKHGWMTATVFNKKAEHKSGVCYISKAEFSELVHTDFDLRTEIDSRPMVQPDWDQEFDATVEREVYHSPYYMAGNTAGDAALGGKYSLKEWNRNKAKSNNSWYSGEYKDYGLISDSVHEEARMLNMGVKKYRKIIENGDEAQLDAITNKLLELGCRSV